MAQVDRVDVHSHIITFPLSDEVVDGGVQLQLYERDLGIEVSRTRNNPTHGVDLHCQVSQDLCCFLFSVAWQIEEQNIDVGCRKGKANSI